LGINIKDEVNILVKKKAIDFLKELNYENTFSDENLIILGRNPNVTKLLKYCIDKNINPSEVGVDPWS
jgi:hypothetical protein